MDPHQRFQEIVDQHYEGVWAYVSVLTRRSGSTEDLVHQAFLLAFDRLAYGKEFTGDPGRWLRGTARNLAFAWWREQRKMPEALVDHLESLVEKGDDAFTRAAKAEVAA